MGTIYTSEPIPYLTVERGYIMSETSIIQYTPYCKTKDLNNKRGLWEIDY